VKIEDINCPSSCFEIEIAPISKSLEISDKIKTFSVLEHLGFVGI
jgi:hypothetical protein